MAREQFGFRQAAPFAASDASEAFYANFSNFRHRMMLSSCKRGRYRSHRHCANALLLFAQAGNSVPMPFLVVLIFWLTMIFASFGLFARPSANVIGCLLIFAISAAGAIYLILELGQPFAGLMEISSAPRRNALPPLGS